jgi:hypothetical protein
MQSKTNMGTLSKLLVLHNTTKSEGGLMAIICILENDVPHRSNFNHNISGPMCGIIMVY